MNESISDYEKNVSKPKHYRSNEMKFKDPECIQITRHLNFNMGNAFKYVWRAGKKGDSFKEIEDLEKALWYLRDQECYPSSLKASEIAQNIFSLLIFEKDPLSENKREAMKSIVFNNLYSASLNIKIMISKILIRDFACADEETKKKVRDILHDMDIPEFLK